MFEITVVETYSDAGQIMSHTAVNDDQVDSFVAHIRESEEKCIENGVIVAYTILSHFQEHNDVNHYAYPRGTFRDSDGRFTRDI